LIFLKLYFEKEYLFIALMAAKILFLNPVRDEKDCSGQQEQ
jgi:hypothetical protein